MSTTTATNYQKQQPTVNNDTNKQSTVGLGPPNPVLPQLGSENQDEPTGTSCEGKVGQTLETVPLVFGHWRATDYTRDIRKCPVVGCKGGNNKSHNSQGRYVHYIHRWDPILPGHGHVSNTRYCTHGHRGIMCSTCLPNW